MTFRPRPEDVPLLEALAFMLRTSQNEVLRRGLYALADDYEPRIREVMDSLAQLKEQR